MANAVTSTKIHYLDSAYMMRRIDNPVLTDAELAERNVASIRHPETDPSFDRTPAAALLLSMYLSMPKAQRNRTIDNLESLRRAGSVEAAIALPIVSNDNAGERA